jgi:hypothetical protein
MFRQPSHVQEPRLEYNIPKEKRTQQEHIPHGRLGVQLVTFLTAYP